MNKGYKMNILKRIDLEQIELNFIDYADRSSIDEIKQLRQLFIDGRIDGSDYGYIDNMFSCFCWVGSLAKIREVDFTTLERNNNSLFEQFILPLREGDTSQNNKISKQVVERIDKYLENKVSTLLSLKDKQK